MAGLTNIQKHEIIGIMGEKRTDSNTLLYEIYTQKKENSLIIKKGNALVDELSIVENIKLNQENTKYINYIDKNKDEKEVGEILRQFNFQFTINKSTKKLSLAEKKSLEIARACQKKSLEILILENPDFEADNQGIELILDTMKIAASKGLAVIFSTDDFKVLEKIATRAIAVRENRKVYDKKSYSFNEFVSALAGRNFDRIHRDIEMSHRVAASKEYILTLENFAKYGSDIAVNIKLKKGEIFGICGLKEDRAKQMGYAIMGLKRKTGIVTLMGKNITEDTPKQNLQNGIVFVPAENTKWIMENHSIKDNLLKTKNIDSVIENMQIACSDPNQIAGTLNGTSMKRLAIAKALLYSPKIIIIENPCRDLNIYAKENIQKEIIKLNEEKGISFLIFSDTISELAQICDTIAIVNEKKGISIFRNLPSEYENIQNEFVGKGVFEIQEENQNG